MDRDEITSALLDESSCAILRVRMGQVEVGLFTEHVDEVMEPSDVTPIPCAPPHLAGLVAVRGEAVPLFDVARFVGLSEVAGGDARRMLIVRAAPYRVALLCDQVLGVAVVPRRSIQEVRVSGPPSLRRYALGEVEIQETVAPVLDLPALLAAGRPR